MMKMDFDFSLFNQSPLLHAVLNLIMIFKLSSLLLSCVLNVHDGSVNLPDVFSITKQQLLILLIF